MGLFSRTIKKEKLSLVIDIGSASVSAALVDFSGDNKPKILLAEIREIALDHDLNFERFEKAMLSAFDASVSAIFHAKKPVPEEAHIFLASPWYAAQTRVIKSDKHTPFTVTSKLLKELTDKETKAFESTELAKYEQAGASARILERKTIDIKLNGYTTADPVGKRATELSMNLFISMSPESVLSRIEESLEKHFRISRVHFSSFLFSSFVVVRDLFISESDFLLLDIGGEVTDISIIKKGALVESASFPLGRNFLMRRLGVFGAERTPASMLSLYLRGTLEPAFASKVGTVLDEAKAQWLATFQKALFELSNDLLIPEKIFLMVDGDVSEWFVKAMEKEEFNQYSLTKKEFSILPLGPEYLHQYLEHDEGVERSPFIMLESVFVARHPKGSI